jgi:hypothetical protein
MTMSLRKVPRQNLFLATRLLLYTSPLIILAFYLFIEKDAEVMIEKCEDYDRPKYHKSAKPSSEQLQMKKYLIPSF